MIFDGLKFFQDYNIEYWEKGTNVQEGWINIQCPFCDDSTNHLGFNETGCYFNCWKCGYHPVKNTIKKLLNIKYHEVDSIISMYDFRIKVIHNLNNKKSVLQKVKLPGSDDLKSLDSKYLLKRNFDPGFILKKYRIRGSNIVGKYKYRIIIPILYNSAVVSFQGRAIANQDPKYKNSSAEESVIVCKDILYNLDNCRKDSICLVEGVLDVWNMGDNFAASFGTAIKEQQIKYLMKYKNIFFMFDPENDAQKKAEKAAAKLSSVGKYTEVIKIEGYKDPGELPESEVKYIKKELKL